MGNIGRFSNNCVEIKYFIEDNYIGYELGCSQHIIPIDNIDLARTTGFIYKFRVVGSRVLFSLDVVSVGVVEVCLGVVTEFKNISLYIPNRDVRGRVIVGIRLKTDESSYHLQGNDIFKLSTDIYFCTICMEVPPEFGLVLSRLSPQKCYEILMPIIQFQIVRCKQYIWELSVPVTTLELDFSLSEFRG